MRSAPALAVLLALLLADPLPAAPPDTVRERVSRILHAYGGWGRLASVRSYRLEGEMFSTMRHTHVPTTRVFARPDRFKTLIDYPDGVEARLLDGGRGWRNAHGPGLDPVDGPMFMSMVLQAARSNVPWILAERESAARFIEPLETDGLKLPGIEIPLGEGLVFRAWTNPVTHLVMVSQGTLETPELSTHFETRYSDFREVAGVKFPFREENFASGMRIGVTTVTRLLVNPPLSPAEFHPPELPDSLKARGSGRDEG